MFSLFKVAITMNTLFCILTVSMTYASIDALQILAIENVAGKSHWNFMSAVLRSLTDVGHNVSVFTPFPDGNRANYTEIYLDLPSKVAMDVEVAFSTFKNPSVMLSILINMTRNFCNIAYEQRDMREILYGGKSINYDIIITEVLASECASYIGSKLGLPVIYIIPSPMITSMEYSVFGDVSNPATVSHLMAHHAIPKTFAQRFLNFVLFGFSLLMLKYKEMELKIIDSQPYDLVEPLKPSLVFMNTHYITDAPRPMPASVIQIGGIHLKTPRSIPNVST
ncbi:PREDICTED: uncharacterized protein LOC107165717 [Diuraphis noxia]|uniref:uncharacterized protein LOC107165717 n=1 Tax=Diuraphis noxia TaxID=143948 RepID=UPI000763B9A2|nr:PREDICTED: uncharacterized protein LOC107165717 [Diuraphis noxia]